MGAESHTDQAPAGCAACGSPHNSETSAGSADSDGLGSRP